MDLPFFQSADPKMKGAQNGNAPKFNKAAQDTIDKLNKIVKENYNNIQELEAAIKEKRQTLETKNEVCAALTAKNHELVSENAKLRENISRLKSAFDDQVQTIAKLQSANAAFEIKLAQLHLNDDTTSSDRYKDLYETEKAKYEAEISKLQFIIVGNRAKAVSQTETYSEEEIAKLKAEINRLKETNLKLQTKVANYVQTMDRSNPFLHKAVGGIYPKIEGNLSKDRKYVTMADVAVKSEIDYNQLKEKVLIIKNLESDPNGDYMSENWYAENNIKICLKNVAFKLFLDGELHVIKELEATTLFEHLFYCNLTTLELIEQSLSYLDFIKLTSSGTIKILKFSKVYIEAKNGGKGLEIDEILKGLKQLEKVEFRLTEYADSMKPSMTRATAQKLGKLDRFQFLRKFELHNLPSAFDRHAFGKFMNKHPNVQFIYSNINADEEVHLSHFEKCKRRLINRLQ